MEEKNVVIEQYVIAIQRTDGNWNYAREMPNREVGNRGIQFFPWNRWIPDIVCFKSKEDAKSWWNCSKSFMEFSPDFNKHFKRDTICIRKRVLFEENVVKISL